MGTIVYPNKILLEWVLSVASGLLLGSDFWHVALGSGLESSFKPVTFTRAVAGKFSNGSWFLACCFELEGAYGPGQFDCNIC